MMMRRSRIALLPLAALVIGAGILAARIVPAGAAEGIVEAARAAYRKPHYLDDIRNVRQLVFGTNAIWPIAVICAIGGVYAVVRINSDNYANDPLLPVIFSFLFSPVPLIPPMLAGFLAPRSTWLAGAIASALATGTIVVVFVLTGSHLDSTGGISLASPSPSTPAVASESAVPSAIESPSLTPSASGSPSASASSAAPSASPAAPSVGPSASPSGTTTTGTTSKQNGDAFTLIIVLLPESLAFGFLMGALSGWYKRFLSATSPPRTRTSGPASKRPAQRRRPTARR
jgi:hypothetical protein